VLQSSFVMRPCCEWSALKQQLEGENGASRMYIVPKRACGAQCRSACTSGTGNGTSHSGATEALTIDIACPQAIVLRFCGVYHGLIIQRALAVVKLTERGRPFGGFLRHGLDSVRHLALLLRP